MIELADFTVRHPGFTLGPLTLRVEPGERVALVGANGAGKTTTLRGLAGLLDRFEGSVTAAGLDVAIAGAAIRCRVGLLPERLLGFGWSTVAEHLALLAAVHPTWDPAHAEELRARLEIPSATKLANLSKGMRVKLALVGAEAFRPDVLLLDEPTSGIDPVMRGRILETIEACAPRGSGRTVLFSTHILEDVEGVADRVLVLREGKLVGDMGGDELTAAAAGGSLSRAILDRLAEA